MFINSTNKRNGGFNIFADIADAGGLPILVDVQKMFGDDIEVCIFLAKIISNLSLHQEYLDDLFRSGKIRNLYAFNAS